MLATGLIIRDETESDRGAIRDIDEAAFRRSTEADIIDRLRFDRELLVSLVGAVDGEPVGHAALSPARLDRTTRAAALGPLAVRPAWQRNGIGRALVDEAIRRARPLCDALFVLGDPRYYARFGFGPASVFGIRCEFEGPDAAFQVLLFRPGSIGAHRSVLRFAAAFREL